MNSLSRRLNSEWAPAFPVNAWLIATDVCNLRCRTCPAHSPAFDWPDEGFSDMQPKVFERVKKELLPGLREIYLSGGGEPFLSPVFYEMLDQVLSPNRSILVVTNATIIKPDVIERITQTPSRIRVSIDGSTNETMKYIRGVKLDRVLKFLDALKEITDRSKHPDFQLEFSVVMTRSNLEQLNEIVEIAHRYGVTSIGFTNFDPYGRTDEFATGESLMHRPEIVLPYWTEARDRAAAYSIGVPEIYFKGNGQTPGPTLEEQSTVYRPDGRMRQCPYPWWNTYITTDGSVKPCCIWPPDATMGNILEQPFSAIWNGPKYRELRRTVNTPDMPEYCRGCFIPARI